MRFVSLCRGGFWLSLGFLCCRGLVLDSIFAVFGFCLFVGIRSFAVEYIKHAGVDVLCFFFDYVYIRVILCSSMSTCKKEC